MDVIGSLEIELYTGSRFYLQPHPSYSRREYYRLIEVKVGIALPAE